VFVIAYQAQEPSFSVDFPDLPDIITSGATRTEAFAHACEALDLHLESLQKLGMPIPSRDTDSWWRRRDPPFAIASIPARDRFPAGGGWTGEGSRPIDGRDDDPS
jgi:predicted RNase H-like HicB family nuclease